MKKPVTLALGLDTCSALDALATLEERSRSQVADRLLRGALAPHQVHQTSTRETSAPEPAASPVALLAAAIQRANHALPQIPPSGRRNRPTGLEAA
jgi:hypothetical protein